MNGTALVLGASGRFGRHAAEAFEHAGWIVRRFDRAHDDLVQSALGADVIVNAWNPPYPKWASAVPGQTKDVIAAAKSADATVIIPGNVYVFGADAPERFAADTPHLAQNSLGRIRIEMERAYRDSGVKTIIVRAGDFLDTEASGNWFDKIIVANIANGKFVYPGAFDKPHAWAFLPDLARAVVQLAEMRDELDQFEDLPFPGFTLTGKELGEQISSIRNVNIKPMSWLPLKILSPFWPMARYLLQMRYLWYMPHHLDGQRLRELLPQFESTPVGEAIRKAVQPLRVRP